MIAILALLIPPVILVYVREKVLGRHEPSWCQRIIIYLIFVLALNWVMMIILYLSQSTDHLVTKLNTYNLLRVNTLRYL